MKNIKHLSFLFTVIILASCSKKPDVEYTSTYKMSGEWFTKYYYNGSEITSPHKILTYNTSDPSSGKIWVEDHDVWPFKSKFDVDYTNLLFKPVAEVENLEIAGENVKVYEGKIIPKAGVSKSGKTVDSIYLKVEFSDDPGEIYEIRGHLRTGFFEDEY